jgi:predicted Fe-Mo cluster-binding NifX family protein
MQGLGVDTLICGAISRAFSKVLEVSGIHVIPWISGDAEEVLEAYMNGTIHHSRYLMPGCEGEDGSEGEGNRQR